MIYYVVTFSQQFLCSCVACTATTTTYVLRPMIQMTPQGSNVILVYKMDPMYIPFLSGKVSVFVSVDYPAFP